MRTALVFGALMALAVPGWAADLAPEGELPPAEVLRAGGHVAVAVQLGNDNFLRIEQAGLRNSARVEQNGSFNYAEVRQWGSDSHVRVQQHGDRLSARVIQH